MSEYNGVNMDGNNNKRTMDDDTTPYNGEVIMDEHIESYTSSSSSSSSLTPSVKRARISDVRMHAKDVELLNDVSGVRLWIQDVLGKQLPEDHEEFREALSDAQILCQLINALHLERVSKDDLTDTRVHIENIHTPATTHIRFLRAYENTTKFLNACQEIGFTPDQLFCWSDLVKNANFSNVIRALSFLKRQCSATARDVNNTSADTFLSPSRGRGLLEVLSPSDEKKPASTTTTTSWTPVKFNTPFALASFASPTSILHTIQNAGITSVTSTDQLQVAVNKIYETSLQRKEKDIQKLSSENQQIHKILQEYRRKLEDHHQQQQDVQSNNNNNNNNAGAPSQSSSVSIVGENSTLTSKKKQSRPSEVHRHKVDKAKTLLQRAVFNPIHRVNSTWTSFANGVKTLLTDMTKDMADTSRQICDRMFESEKNHKLLQEAFCKEQRQRKKLLNRVIELTGNIRVFTRIRPISQTEKTAGQSVCVTYKGQTVSVNGAHKDYMFDHVFGPRSTQEQVFAEVQPLVQSAIDGYNTCIFAYGQTGSGKTYTMSGGDGEQAGVNIRGLQELFHVASERSSTHRYKISLSILEIYNEIPTDLLVDKQKNRVKLNIRENSRLGVHIPELTEVPVCSVEEVTTLMNKAHMNRSVGVTSMNEHSSRSHSVVIINIRGENVTTMDRSHGKLVLIDLAGSERIKKSQASGERLKEAQHINKSLSALGNVVSALQAKNSHIPFRDSKLTYLLQDCLSGNSKCLMFCQVSPIGDSTQETLCSLQFASRVSKVQLGQATAQVQDGENLKLRQKLQRCREAMQAKENTQTGLLKEKSQMAAQIRSNENKVMDLEKQLRVQVDEAKSQLKAKNDECQALRDEVSALKRQLAETTENAATKYQRVAPSSSSSSSSSSKKKFARHAHGGGTMFTVKEEPLAYTTPVKTSARVLSTPLSSRATRTPLPVSPQRLR